ncbi:type II toxin-antitoxin system HicB family antitoxin [Candidatus Pacearchaeota archaeon]|nr:type II toxin-antitoxin system HicB family antitoxin [Candidatus Pacearchaeota archaeon]
MDFNIIIEKGEDGYLLSEVIELPGCRTQAKDMNELLKRTKEVITLYLQVEEMSTRNSFLGVQKIAV